MSLVARLAATRTRRALPRLLGAPSPRRQPVRPRRHRGAGESIPTRRFSCSISASSAAITASRSARAASKSSRLSSPGSDTHPNYGSPRTPAMTTETGASTSSPTRATGPKWIPFLLSYNEQAFPIMKRQPAPTAVPWWATAASTTNSPEPLPRTDCVESALGLLRPECPRTAEPVVDQRSPSPTESHFHRQLLTHLAGYFRCPMARDPGDQALLQIAKLQDHRKHVLERDVHHGRRRRRRDLLDRRNRRRRRRDLLDRRNRRRRRRDLLDRRNRRRRRRDLLDRRNRRRRRDLLDRRNRRRRRDLLDRRNRRRRRRDLLDRRNRRRLDIHDGRNRRGRDLPHRRKRGQRGILRLKPVVVRVRRGRGIG